jgi:hypothetical protein
MASSDTPAPAVPLEGARDTFNKLVREFGETAYECGQWTKDDDEDYAAVAARHEAASAKLAAFVSGLLADAALLDRLEVKVRADGDVGIVGISLDNTGAVAVCTPGCEWSDGFPTARDALSRALPEGGA